MDSSSIANYRLASQRIVGSSYKSPGELVAFMGAMQAQSYYDALWAVGLRLNNATKDDVELAISKKQIVRTWPMRHTLHFVSSNDVRWMLALYRDEVIPSYQRKNGLTDAILEQGEEIIEKAFDEKGQLTSKEIYKSLGDSGNPVLKKRDVQAHILRRAGRDGIVCFASRDGKQPTFALLEKWLPKVEHIEKDHSLGELASRYFTSHGPATRKDFVWWSGLKVSDARIGIEKASSKLAEEEINGKAYYMPKKMPEPRSDEPNVHLLPAFDEYIVSYSDRSAMLSNEKTQKMLKSGEIFFTHSNGIFLPTIVADGQVVGTWKRKNEKNRITITLQPFLKLSSQQMKGVKDAVERYGNFLETPVILE